MEFNNIYQDRDRAASYAGLQFPGTYYLAYRDLPEIVGEGMGKHALDFGCGTGRSTRFLTDLGFAAVGVDISPEMLDQARQIDPDGDYRQVADDDSAALGVEAFDVILAAFTFDNIPGSSRKASTLERLGGLLANDGRIVLVVSAPEIYVNEWASFTTSAYPENRSAGSGDIVRIVMKDVDDGRAVEDVLCTDEGYRSLFAVSGLTLRDTLRPLGRADEPFEWISETEIPAWTIYVLSG